MMKTLRHTWSSERCPKSNTAHRDGLITTLVLSVVFGFAWTAQFARFWHRPLGAPLLIAEFLIMVAFVGGVSLVVEMWMARRRGWL